MREYVTSQGDMWDAIAKRLYGDERMMPVLIAANPQARQVVVFSAGVTLSVPEAVRPEPERVRPPWERAA